MTDNKLDQLNNMIERAESLERASIHADTPQLRDIFTKAAAEVWRDIQDAKGVINGTRSK